ncbi:hypothetical protein PHYPSEUDO_001848 [Phytophthora pseudosyringae]|uniref:Uncharacterized protein n=1 Tax=Phytophthora pseudosyringae TaxID=221518 RepID=A0A8T1VUY9_9STRA|nr:hypothetical protein PHYPSEUDO_001848 [Phytophthora pseudosyringae]
MTTTPMSTTGCDVHEQGALHESRLSRNRPSSEAAVEEDTVVAGGDDIPSYDNSHSQEREGRLQSVANRQPVIAHKINATTEGAAVNVVLSNHEVATRNPPLEASIVQETIVVQRVTPMEDAEANQVTAAGLETGDHVAATTNQVVGTRAEHSTIPTRSATALMAATTSAASDASLSRKRGGPKGSKNNPRPTQ